MPRRQGQHRLSIQYSYSRTCAREDTKQGVLKRRHKHSHTPIHAGAVFARKSARDRRQNADEPSDMRLRVRSLSPLEETSPVLSSLKSQSSLSLRGSPCPPWLVRSLLCGEVWLAVVHMYTHTAHRTQNHGKERAGGGGAGFVVFSIFLHFPTNGRVLQ